jgi:hypothetical protein
MVHRRHVAGAVLLAWLAALAGLGAGTRLGLASGPGSGAGFGPATAYATNWSGGIDLYRPGVFTTQQSWLWCTAADAQIARNIAFHATDHSAASQRAYFDWMRTQNRYPIPLSDGIDPAGWTAGMRRYVDGRYRLVESPSFGALLRSAVTNLRRTNRPVGLFVAHGDHAWLLTGFTATADPAVTSAFTVTSVRVVGPLYGLQSRTYGYDMPPDTRLTPAQLAGFVSPWHYARIRMAWEGHYISIQPVASSPTTTARRASTATARPKSAAQAAASPGPRPSPAASPPASSPSSSPVTAALEASPSGAATNVGAVRPLASRAGVPVAGNGWDLMVVIVPAAIGVIGVLGIARAVRFGSGKRR